MGAEFRLLSSYLVLGSLIECHVLIVTHLLLCVPPLASPFPRHPTGLSEACARSSAPAMRSSRAGPAMRSSRAGPQLRRSKGSEPGVGTELSWGYPPTSELTWVCAQTPVERRRSCWKGPFCTSMLVGERVSKFSPLTLGDLAFRRLFWRAIG